MFAIVYSDYDNPYYIVGYCTDKEIAEKCKGLEEKRIKLDIELRDLRGYGESVEIVSMDLLTEEDLKAKVLAVEEELRQKKQAKEEAIKQADLAEYNRIKEKYGL